LIKQLSHSVQTK